MRTLALIALFALSRAAPLQQESGAVTGQIRSTNGASVAGVRIAAMVVPQPGAAATNASTLERLTTTDNDGRFRLENLRAGRYYITAGFIDQPTYFPGVPTIAEARVVVVAAGSAVSAVDFSLAQSPGVKVTGRINGIPGDLPAGYIRVVLTPIGPTPPARQPNEALVSRDGSFEFPKVGPGSYNLRTNPVLLIPPPNIRVDVKDSDVGPLGLTIGPIIVGQVNVENGSPLPLPMAVANLNIANAAGNITPVNLPSLVTLIAIRATNPSSTTSFGGTVRADGAFVVANFQPGEYRIGARLPFGYTIKSMTFGDINLLTTTLKIADAASVAGSVRVVLTTPSPGTSGGVKVSGRVTGAPPPSTAWISMQTSSSLGRFSEGGNGETMVRPDGTFEFQRVPPGMYFVQVLPPQGAAPQIFVAVDDVDVTNVEVPDMAPPAAATAGPPPALGTPTFPNMPAPLAVQPPSYPPGVTVTGRVSMENTPRAVVLFGPRDGLSVQAPIRSDGTFEIQNVPAGNYDARTLPLMMPSVSTRLTVGDKDVIGVTLNAPGARTTQ